MNIALKKDLQEWIDEEVRSGRYRSEAEVIEDALRDKMEKAEADRLWERIQESEQQIDRGEYVVADDAFFESLRARVREIAAQRRR